MTIIVAKYVNPPKEGKRYGSIKTPEGSTQYNDFQFSAPKEQGR